MRKKPGKSVCLAVLAWWPVKLLPLSDGLAFVSPTGQIIPGQVITELRNDIDKISEQRTDGYCGSCYGGLPPEGGCCNSCEDVRQAYVNRGWSFNNPEAIEQVRFSYSTTLGPSRVLMKYVIVVVL